MKKMQMLFAAATLAIGLAGAVSADKGCCKPGAECCKKMEACCTQQKGTKAGWFTGAGTMAKSDNKAGGDCCSTKSDNKAGNANDCCTTKADNKAGSDNKAGGCCK